MTTVIRLTIVLIMTAKVLECYETWKRNKKRARDQDDFDLS